MRPLPHAVSLMLCTMWCGALGAEEPACRVATVLDARSAVGSGERSGIRLHRYGAGVQLRLTPVLEARLLLTGLRLAGRTDVGEPTPVGLGGEAGLYLFPWPMAWARPYVFASAGILGFPVSPFLPGASRYDFQTAGGAGVDFSIDARWTLGLEALGTHVSNGQGIGPHNPALDGYGAGLHASYGLAPRGELDDPWEGAPRDGDGTAVAVDGGAGVAAGSLLGYARARVAQRLLDGLLLVVDGESGELAGRPFGEVGAAFATHVGPVTLGAHGGYRRFIGIDTALGALQLEGHITSEVSLAGMVHAERDPLQGGFWRGASAVRVYPIPSLMLAGGVGAGPLGHRSDTSDVIPYAAAEWALPISVLRSWQLAIFAESRATEVRLAGLRVAYDVGAGPRDWSRRTGWRRLR